MRAVHLQDGIVSVSEAPLPETPPGHALIRMLHAGICSTDLHLQRGYYGFAGRPGHEFVGRVVECADPRWRGKLVVGEINLACHQCDWCRRGLARHCPHRSVLGIVRHPGAFAEFLTLPVENLHEAPSGIPEELAVFTEPAAAACEILDQVTFSEGAEAAVLGDGKLGLLIAQVLQQHGVQVHLYGRHAHKMAIVEPLGIDCRQTADGLSYEYVVEATGSALGLETAIRMTRPRGTLILKSTVAAKVTIDTAPIIVNEISMVGSRCGRFEPALAMMAAGKLILEPLIEARYPLSEAAAAFQRAASKGALKVLLRG
jgi:alcohol dehydrogenase